MENKNGIKQLYTLEQLQDSNILKEKSPTNLIKYFLFSLVSIFVLAIVIISFLKVDLTIESTVSVESSKTPITLQAQTKGKVEEIYKKDSEEVKENEELLKLKNAEYESNIKSLEEQKENLELRKSKLERLYESVKLDSDKLEKDDDEYYRDEYEGYIQAKINIEEEQSILEKEENNNEVLLAQVKEKLQNLKTTVLRGIREKIIELEDMLKTKNIEIEESKNLNESLILRAPQNGMIKFEKTVVKDNDVEMNQSLITFLPEGSRPKIILYIDPKDIKRLQENQEVTIKFNTEQKITIRAKIVEIASLPTPINISKENSEQQMINLYEVNVETLNENNNLAIGMNGQAEVKVGQETMWRYIKRKIFN